MPPKKGKGNLDPNNENKHKIKDDPKNEKDPKNEHKNQEDPKNKDNPKK